MSSRPRRIVPFAALLTATAMTLTACGGTGSEEAAATSSAPGGAEQGAFPVTVEHTFGETTIDDEPTRVVTVGLKEQDDLLALGVVPVATSQWPDETPGAAFPWAQDLIGDADVPTLLDNLTDGIQFEGEVYALGPTDPRSRLLTDLGLVVPDDLAAVLPDANGGPISAERVDLLDLRTVVWTADPEVVQDEVLTNRVYTSLAVDTEGRDVFIADSSEYGQAFSFVTVLSLPYIYERLVPQLVAATDGDPAIEVPAT